MQQAVESELIKSNPCRKARIPKVCRPEIKPLTDEQIHTAAMCLPYSDKDLFLVKNTGFLSVISNDIPVRKGTNAEGVIVSEGPPVASAFIRPDVVVMVDTLGHMVFIDEADFLSKGSAKKGVKAQSIPAGSCLLHAFGLYYNQVSAPAPSVSSEADSLQDATVPPDSSGEDLSLKASDETRAIPSR